MKSLLHQNNTLAYSSIVIITAVSDCVLEIVDHSYFPDFPNLIMCAPIGLKTVRNHYDIISAVIHFF